MILLALYFLIIALISQCTAQSFSYTIGSAAFAPAQQIFASGDTISIQWVVNAANGTDTSDAKCYVAIRPVTDLKSDGAIVMDSNNQPGAGPLYCMQQSFTLTVPKSALNNTIQLNGQSFVGRINTDNGFNTQTSTFKLYEKMPADTTYRLALASTIIAGVTGIIALVALFVSCLNK